MWSMRTVYEKGIFRNCICELQVWHERMDLCRQEIPLSKYMLMHFNMCTKILSLLFGICDVWMYVIAGRQSVQGWSRACLICEEWIESVAFRGKIKLYCCHNQRSCIRVDWISDSSARYKKTVLFSVDTFVCVCAKYLHRNNCKAKKSFPCSYNLTDCTSGTCQLFHYC